MEFYFRKQGRTVGPVQIFRALEMLEAGELTATDLGWHEGMAEWRPVAEMPVLDRQLKAAEAEETDAKEIAEPAPSWTPPTGRTLERVAQMRQRHAWAWQRFLARSLDLTIFSAVALGLAIGLGWIEPGEVLVPRFSALLAVTAAWMLVDGLCLWRWGATPGKALLGLRVVTAEGGKLPMRSALRRAFDVWFFGYGMDLPLLSWLLKLLAMTRLRATGETAWDSALKLRVEHRPVSTLGVTLALLLFVGVVGVKLACFFHYPLPSYFSPDERALWEAVHPAAMNAPEA